MGAIELGCPYYVVGSNDQQFAINVPSDPNFVGYVTDVTGIDDTNIRENAQVKVAGDGGLHGPFWKDRRPWTISGFIVPQMPVAARSAAQDYIAQIMDTCLQADGYLVWYPTNSEPRYVAFRKQQPLRITKGQSNVERNFQLAGVCADPRIYGYGPVNEATTEYGGSVTVFNAGTTNSPPTLTLTLTGGIFVATNETTGQQLVGSSAIAGYSGPLVITLSGNYPSAIGNLGDMSGYLAAPATDWDFALAPGENVLTVVNMGEMVVQWRDAWS